MSYPVDVIWINFEQKEQVYVSHLQPGSEESQITISTHKLIFKQSCTDNRLYASANGMKEETFEGCSFAAQINTIFRIDIVAEGNFIGVLIKYISN